jgi:hypothetical protein
MPRGWIRAGRATPDHRRRRRRSATLERPPRSEMHTAGAGHLTTVPGLRGGASVVQLAPPTPSPPRARGAPTASSLTCLPIDNGAQGGENLKLTRTNNVATSDMCMRLWQARQPECVKTLWTDSAPLFWCIRCAHSAGRLLPRLAGDGPGVKGPPRRLRPLTPGSLPAGELVSPTWPQQRWGEAA